jgi:hypothetical protein
MLVERALPKEAESIHIELGIRYQNADLHESYINLRSGTWEYSTVLDIPLLQELSRQIYDYQHHCQDKSIRLAESGLCKLFDGLGKYLRSFRTGKRISILQRM